MPSNKILCLLKPLLEKQSGKNVIAKNGCYAPVLTSKK